MSRMTWIVLGVEAALATVGLVVGAWIGTPILEVTRVDLPSGALAVAVTIPLLALLLWGLHKDFAFLARMREIVVPLFASCSRFEILLVAIAAGIGEEILFRGLLQASLARVLDPWIALALVSVLFGLVHYVSLAYAIVAALLGATLGATYLATGNLFVAIAVHALYDFGALLFLLRLGVSAPPGPISDQHS